jgi:hypothetical protein
MDTLQMIQSITPAATITALLALPWIAVVLMHAVSAKSSVALDDKWNSRAQAALRWAGTVAAPNSKQVHAEAQYARAA